MRATNNNFSSWEEAVIWLRNQPDKQALVQDAYYDDPLIAAADRYWRSEEWEEVRPYLRHSGNKALDVGAGRGIASYALAKEGFLVTALEPDGSSVVGAGAIRELASRSDLTINVVQDFSESLPFSDRYFDLVFARAVLHHTEDLKAACGEFFRVLKPGGVLVAIREHVISRAEDLEVFLDIHPLHKLYGGEYAYLLKEYLDALRSVGFVIQKIIDPLQSPINFAPYSEESLKDEISKRIPGPSWLRKGVRPMLNLPLMWPACRGLVSLLDNRPGRLYSFICQRT